MVTFAPGDAAELIYAADAEYEEVTFCGSIDDLLRELVEGKDDLSTSWRESLENAHDEQDFDNDKLDRLPELRLLLAQKVPELRATGDVESADKVQRALDIYIEAFGTIHHPWPDPTLE